MIAADARALGLLTDLYQLTMAAGYLKAGKADREAVFHLFFRRCPFGGGYAVACGLAQVVELLGAFRFTSEDTEYLAGLEGNDGRPLFSPEFLEYLASLELSVSVDAVPEGTVVFPHEPLLRVRGPLAQCQVLETPLLTITNFQTLIATKASRVVAAAGGDPVLEFGLRRAQGVDGGLSASRAAFVGGCAATSNVLAGKRFGIPVRGTHAHSWVMAFDGEREAFEAWADASPNNCIFLVDTYDSIWGIENAIRSGRELRRRGHEMVGIRLDSGDFVTLSREARRRLDAAGFPGAAIVASNDLDERRIARLKAAGAKVGVWGVGTRLATAHGQAALGGVYKLTAIRDREGAWRNKLKLSEEKVKISNPGIQQVCRFSRDGRFLADVIYDQTLGLSELPVLVDPEGRRREIPADADGEDLLRPVTRGGAAVYDPPASGAARERTLAQLGRLDPAVRRLDDPAVYPVGLDLRLHELKESLVARVRSEREGA